MVRSAFAASCIWIVALPPIAEAGQTKIKNYSSTRDTYVYKMLYKRGGYTLYCGMKFKCREGLQGQDS